MAKCNQIRSFFIVIAFFLITDILFCFSKSVIYSTVGLFYVFLLRQMPMNLFYSALISFAADLADLLFIYFVYYY